MLAGTFFRGNLIARTLLPCLESSFPKSRAILSYANSCAEIERGPISAPNLHPRSDL